MNKASLNHPRQSLRVWIALFASISIHAAAVAIAQLDRETTPTVGTSEPPVIIVEYPPSTEPPPDDVAPIETPPPLPPNDESIPEDAATPPPRQIRKIVAPLPHPPNNFRISLPNQTSARLLALSAPRPEYPYEARRQRLTGDGVALIAIDPASGVVVNVTMAKSTGTAVLDQATIAGLRRWRFKAGTSATVRCPITFTLTGALF